MDFTSRLCKYVYNIFPKKIAIHVIFDYIRTTIIDIAINFWCYH
jgi:hypothetical protein